MRITVRKVVAAIIIWQILWRAVALLFPRPFPTRLSFVLNSRVRRALAGPTQLLPRLGLEKGYTVLEIGPGTGVFTVEAARAVGPEGTVYALDINPSMLARVLMRAEDMGLQNIVPLHADARSIPLPAASVDVAFMVGVLGEVPDRYAALRELYRVIKPGGLLSITEMLTDPHYLPGPYISRLAKRCGFDAYWSEGMPWFRTHIFRRPAPDA